jgi:DNA-binding FrmR family transcriptional regulator
MEHDGADRGEPIAPHPDHCANPHAGPHRKTKAVVNQLSRTAGHLGAVKRMVEEGRPCTDVLIQLAAVRAAVDRVSRLVLEDHVESCLRGAVDQGRADAEWASLKEALDKFVR